ncbi:MAG: metal-dependent hydrolase [Planctomycetaceae bacterium]|nr:metal-dependent hydrolase [Planctomycetaceae bacterium]|tara:strand:- start:24 stop:851 length:828 start_codon:yes stop_codon:yes gene_type:complete
MPVKSLTYDDLTIEGFSRAAVQTYWRVPELKLGFDLGAHPWEFMGTPNWFVTHCHMDHIVALPVYVARRRMMKMDPPNIYLPLHAVDVVHQILKAYTKLDRGRLPCNLIGVEPGDEIELNREYLVTVGETRHTIPSQSYLVWHRRNKLKSEYSDLSGEEIRDLRQSGQEVSREVRLPLLGYTGDTCAEGLDLTPALYQAKILITEMTFVAEDHSQEKIRKNGHIHLTDFVDRAEKFENELIIASHFSTRYNYHQVKKLVQDALPDSLAERLHLWL